MDYYTIQRMLFQQQDEKQYHLLCNGMIIYRAKDRESCEARRKQLEKLRCEENIAPAFERQQLTLWRE